MKQFIAILVFAAALATEGRAQTFLKDLQQQRAGEGTVTVKQSADIDNLVNNAKLKAAQTQAAAPKQKPQDDKEKNNSQPKKEEHAAPANGHAASHQTEEQHRGDSAAHRQPASEQHQQPAEKHSAQKPADRQTPAAADHPAVDTSKKMMRNSRKVTGYRIQAYSGGNSRADREKANRIGDAIKMKYPDQPVYVHFYSPRWICRVGNFRSYNEAAQVLKGIKAMGYSQACIVKGKITVGY